VASYATEALKRVETDPALSLKSTFGAKLAAEAGRIIPLVFHHKGRPMRDFRKAWATACDKAGCPGRIFHDLRRSAVRRFEHGGIARRVAMTLTGHTTENVYRRYAVVSDRELREAAATLSRASMIPGTIAPRQGGRSRGTMAVSWCAQQDSNLRPSDS
jgi:integrase